MVKFYECKHCGQIIEMVNNSDVPVTCCGEQMVEMVTNTSDGAGEKHVPVVTVDGSTVKVNVGEVDHPMTEAHYIPWIVVETCCGVYRKNLKPGDAPTATFEIGGMKAKAVYAYCNLHGLWKTEL